MAEELNPTSLGDILSGADPKPAEPAPVTTEAAPAPASAAPTPEAPERQRRPDGTFAPVEAKTDKPEPKPEAPKPEAKPEAKPPQEEMTPKERALLQTAIEERRKRQDLEREMAQLRQAQAPAAPQEPPKAFLDDPDGALQRYEQGVHQVATNTVVKTSEMIARMKHPDYDEKVAVFARICEAQPDKGRGYFQAVLNSPDPAEFVYSEVKKMQDRHEWEAAGGAEGMKAKIETELRAKWDAEQKAKEKERLEKEEALPGSLSHVPGSGLRSAPVWTGPTSLDDVLKH